MAKPPAVPSSKKPAAKGGKVDGSKRDFLMLTTGAVAGVGAVGAAWPFVKTLQPAKDVLAMATTEADISQIAEGDARTVMWRGQPVFIRHRTPEEIAEARAVDVAALPDPQEDSARVKKDEWLVVVGKCTHLGCVPSGQKGSDERGEYNGWYCPCHGSHYDTSGRIRRGPAVANLEVPDYVFVSDTRIIIGTDKDAANG